MKRPWDPIVKSTGDLQKTATRLLDEGITHFQATFGNLPLLSSARAEIGGDRDETHYFLVPGFEEGGYSLYRTRVLPEGVGPENDLPKARIFQLPASGTSDHLFKLLSHELKDAHLQSAEFDSPLANRLDDLADEIDRQSDLVSGGLILVAGVVAIANPLLGVGIAAKSLIPGIGSKLSSHGMKHASGWLQSRKKQSAENDATKSARAEVKKLKPETRENKVLALLEKSLNSPQGDFDPLLESDGLFENPEEARDLRLGAQAVLAIHEEHDHFSPKLAAWVTHLKTL